MSPRQKTTTSVTRRRALWELNEKVLGSNFGSTNLGNYLLLIGSGLGVLGILSRIHSIRGPPRIEFRYSDTHSTCAMNTTATEFNQFNTNDLSLPSLTLGKWCNCLAR